MLFKKKVIEHVKNPKEFLTSCSACLKPNGSLFISTMNRNLKSYLLTILGAEYILKIIPKGFNFFFNL